MTLIQTIPFTINTTGAFKEKYPDLSTGFFSVPIRINNNSYFFKIFPNFYMENAEISILNEADEPIISNLPFVFSKNVNYLIGDKAFNNYKLIYNMKQQRFELYFID